MATNPPIQINPSAIPDLAAVFVRYAAALLSGWLIRKGVLTGADEPLVFGLLTAAATIGWAAYRAWSHKALVTTLGRNVDDSVAVVTEPSPPPSAA